MQSHGMLATPKSLVVILSPWQCRSNRRCWHHHASRHFLGSRQEGQALRQERRNGCGHHHNRKHSTGHLFREAVTVRRLRFTLSLHFLSLNQSDAGFRERFFCIRSKNLTFLETFPKKMRQENPHEPKISLQS